jgi:hypothetical protein
MSDIEDKDDCFDISDEMADRLHATLNSDGIHSILLSPLDSMSAFSEPLKNSTSSNEFHQNSIPRESRPSLQSERTLIWTLPELLMHSRLECINNSGRRPINVRSDCRTISTLDGVACFPLERSISNAIKCIQRSFRTHLKFREAAANRILNFYRLYLEHRNRSEISSIVIHSVCSIQVVYRSHLVRLIRNARLIKQWYKSVKFRIDIYGRILRRKVIVLIQRRWRIALAKRFSAVILCLDSLARASLRRGSVSTANLSTVYVDSELDTCSYVPSLDKSSVSNQMCQLRAIDHLSRSQNLMDANFSSVPSKRLNYSNSTVNVAKFSCAKDASFSSVLICTRKRLVKKLHYLYDAAARTIQSFWRHCVSKVTCSKLLLNLVMRQKCSGSIQTAAFDRLFHDGHDYLHRMVANYDFSSHNLKISYKPLILFYRAFGDKNIDKFNSLLSFCRISDDQYDFYRVMVWIVTFSNKTLSASVINCIIRSIFKCYFLCTTQGAFFNPFQSIEKLRYRCKSEGIFEAIRHISTELYRYLNFSCHCGMCGRQFLTFQCRYKHLCATRILQTRRLSPPTSLSLSHGFGKRISRDSVNLPLAFTNANGRFTELRENLLSNLLNKESVNKLIESISFFAEHEVDSINLSAPALISRFTDKLFSVPMCLNIRSNVVFATSIQSLLDSSPYDDWIEVAKKTFADVISLNGLIDENFRISDQLLLKLILIYHPENRKSLSCCFSENGGFDVFASRKINNLNTTLAFVVSSKNDIINAFLQWLKLQFSSYSDLVRKLSEFIMTLLNFCVSFYQVKVILELKYYIYHEILPIATSR